MTLEVLLGIPYAADNDLLRTARRLGAPVLLSVNSLARRSWVADGKRRRFPATPRAWRRWDGFDLRPLRHLAGIEACLDSAGFVAMHRYGWFDWTVDEYLGVAAAFPWRWFAAMDLCVEPEVARDEAEVLDRISGTVRLNALCLAGAQDRGIASRLMPVIQGWRVDHYLRCLDRMPLAQGSRVLGVGSMCRRPVLGPHGVLQVVHDLDRALGADRTKLHLFGVKTDALPYLAGHPRIASVDSQAYGTQARMQAANRRRHGREFSKTARYTATMMAHWYWQQIARLHGPVRHWQPVELEPPRPAPQDEIEAHISASQEQMRALHEAGEIEWTGLFDGSGEAAFYCQE